MKTFSLLYTKLDQTNSTLDKVEILSNFFKNADHEDAAWTIYIMMGKQKKRLVKRSTLVKVLEDISGRELANIRCLCDCRRFAETRYCWVQIELR